MHQHISGNVRGLGRTYKNGFPVLEIHVPISRANGLLSVFFLNRLLFPDYTGQVDKFPDYFGRRYFRLA
jgi:hypothetical protein